MSRAAEEAHDRWMKTHLEECARDLVVGARVYRAEWDQIEEGEVVRVVRVRVVQGAWSGWQDVEDPGGNVVRYHAAFRSGTRWEVQGYQWRFFFRREDAQKDLARRARERAKDLRLDADKWDALAAAQDTAVAAVEAKVSP